MGTGHGTPVNSVFNIGTRAANENIFLYITTDENPSHTYYSDPATANPDGIEHVGLSPINSNVVKVGFEDLLNGGDRDFNDIDLSVTCRPIINPPPVPEFPTMAFPIALIIGLLGAVLFIQKSKED